jgi:hypothetical protein
MLQCGPLATPSCQLIMPNTEVRALIDTFATQLETLVKRIALQQVLAALEGSEASPRRRGPGRPKGTTNRKRGRRTAADVEQMGATLLDYVKANPGARGEQIAAALKSDVGTIRGPMKALIAAKKISTQGQKRGMQYFLVGANPGKRSKKA